MKNLRFASPSLSIVCALALTALPRAMSETSPARNAKALLDEAKKNQSERKRAAMQKELDRLAEDAQKGKQEIDDLEKSMSKVGNAVAETKSHIDQLAVRKKRVLQDMELVPLQIQADKLKEEALNLLNSAHAKAADAVAKRKEELDLRTALVSAEMEKMSEPEKVGESDSKRKKSESAPARTELRRNLEKAEGRTALANERAHEALEAASLKLQQAEAAAAKAEKKQAEIDRENNPNSPAGAEPVKPKAKTER